MFKEVQVDEFVSLADLKPEVSSDGIFFPVSVKHVNLNKYHGDARSFGYHFDDGHCTVIRYEQVVGTLAEDTIEMLADCETMRKKARKPDVDKLEASDDETEFSKENSELLIRYGNDFFYKDEHGYWLSQKVFGETSSYRVTEESAQIYRAENKAYQDSIKAYNKIMKQALENIDLLKETLTCEQ